MPQFLGHRIADDPASLAERVSSSSGFIETDVPLLLEMRILIKDNGQPKPNPKLTAVAEEIKDFMRWISGPKTPPMPPLAVKILCLKRASILNSSQSANLGNKLRTGEKHNLEEIDGLLRSTGVTEFADAEKCKTGGTKYVAPPLPPATVIPAAAIPATAIIPTAATSTPCVTHVHCDNSAVVALLTEVMKKIDCLENMAPASLEDATRDLEAFKVRLLTLQQHIDDLHKRVPAGEPFKLESINNNGTDDSAADDDDATTLRSIAGTLKPDDPAKPIIDAAVDTLDKTNRNEKLLILLQTLGTKNPTVTRQIEAMLNKPAPINSATITTLTGLNGKVAEATQNVSELPTNYRMIVNHLMAELNPMLKPMIQDISDKLSSLDTKVGYIGNATDYIGNTTVNIANATNVIKTEIAGLRKNVSGLYSHIKDNTQLILDELTKRTTALTELIRVTHTDNSAFQPTIDALQTAVRDLSARTGNLQRTNGDGRKNANIAENERLIAEIEELRKRLVETDTVEPAANDDRNARIVELEQEVARLRSESPRRNGLVGELESDRANRTANISAKEDELRRLREELEVERASEEKAKLQSTLAQLQEEHRHLQENIAELTRASAGKQGLEDEVARLTAEGRDAAALEAEIARLTELLADREELARLLAQCKESETGLREALEQKDRESTEKSDERTAELEKLNSDAKADISARNAEYERLLSEMREGHNLAIRNSVDTQRHACDDELAEQKRISDERITALEQELEALRNAPNPNLAAKDKEIAELTRRCQEIQGEAEKAKNSDNSKTIENERLLAGMDELEKSLTATGDSSKNIEIKSLLAEIAELRKLLLAKNSDDGKNVENERLLATMDELKESLTTNDDSRKNIEIKSLRAEMAELRNSLAANAVGVNDGKNARIAELEQELATATKNCDEEIKRLTEQLRQCREALARLIATAPAIPASVIPTVIPTAIPTVTPATAPASVIPTVTPDDAPATVLPIPASRPPWKPASPPRPFPDDEKDTCPPRPVPQAPSSKMNATYAQSAWRGFGDRLALAGMSMKEKGKWVTLFGKLIQDFNANKKSVWVTRAGELVPGANDSTGTPYAEIKEDIDEFMKITQFRKEGDTGKGPFDDFLKCLRYTKLSETTYKDHLHAIIDFFKRINTPKGGTRRRKQKSQRRTRKL
jgi:hypothetical protein